MTFCKMMLKTLCLILVASLATSEDDMKNVCFDEKIGDSVCRCETIYSDHLILPETESRLLCVGEDSLEMAVEASTFQKNLMFVELVVTNGTFEAITLGDLEHFVNLKNLTVSSNRVSSIGEDAFKSQNNLEHLDLSSNNLTVLPNAVLDPLVHLKNLSLSHNQMRSIEAKALNDLHSLLLLDLSHNRLSSIDCGWFAGAKSLQVLSLRNNGIGSLNGSFHLIHLQLLDLSSNNLKHIPSPTFFRLKSLKFLSLAMNELTTLNEGAFKGNINLEKVNLTGNPWECDRRLLPLNDWLKRYEAYREGATCAQPPDFHNYTVQHGLDIVHLEVKIEESPTCSQNACRCSISRDKLVITVDCSDRGLTRLPEVVPYKTRVLDLRRNRIRSLTTDHIEAALWSDVSFLYLNHNVIDSLKGLEGTWLLRNLVALHLSHNRLTEIPIHILEQFRGGSLDELHLSANPWNCDCHTVRFQTWLQDNYRAVRGFDSICCSSESAGPFAGQPIYRLKKSQLCPQQVRLVNWLDVVNGLMAVAICLIVVKLSYDYWLQKRTGKLPRFFSLNLA